MLRRRDRSLLADAALLLLCGIIAGTVVAAVAFPFAAAGGLSAKQGADSFEHLPSELTIPPIAETTDVYASDGKTLITSFYSDNRRDVPIGQIAPVMQQAIVAAEDSRFYHHSGVDFRGVLRAFVANNQSGQVQQGASTLTMQYVRNVLVYSAQSPQQVQDATAGTANRKLREMRYALALEKKLNKQQILDRYLNIAFFGHVSYGVYAAAETYFHTTPDKLTLGQAAMLAGLVKAPTSFDPMTENQKPATDRRNWVLDRMVDQGSITRAAAEQTKRQPIQLHPYTHPNGCTAIPANHLDWGYFCDFLQRWWDSQPAFGNSTQARDNKLRQGGYRIISTLDPHLQQSAREHILARQDPTSKYALGEVVVEPGTGRIKAMAVNRNYSLDQTGNGPNTDPAKRNAGLPGNYPNTVNPLLSGGDGLSGYQAGSTFKMFTMLAALNQGKPLSTNIYAPQRYTSHVFKNEDPGSDAACGGMWCPSNASSAMTGNQTMWSGYGKSVNTYFAQLIERVGAPNAVAMAKQLGIQFRSPVDQNQANNPVQTAQWGSFTLGVVDTTPLDLANAYATVAAQGRYCTPLPIASMTGSDGKAAAVPGQCTQVVPQDVARAATDAARCPVSDKPFLGDCGSWSTAPQVHGIVGRPVAGKTGTTDSTRAAWFVAFTPQLAAASFLADPDNPFDAVGDAQSNKPIETVAWTLHDGSMVLPYANFVPESRTIAYGNNRDSAPADDNNGRSNTNSRPNTRR